MEFENSSLFQEVTAIQSSEAKKQYTWKVRLHIGDTDYDVYKLLSIDDVRDFNSTFAPEVVATVAMPPGMYAYDVYPNQDNLEMTIFQYPVQETGDMPDDNGELITKRYRAILDDHGNPAVDGNDGFTPTREALDLSDIVNIRFQLISKQIEQLRAIAVGGTYRDVKVEDVIKSVLTNESLKIKTDDEEVVKGVDMVAASNQKPRDHVILPSMLPLTLVPEYIHQNCGGVYSTGLGYFFQDNQWYVYPCYDTERYEKAQSTITIINVPRNKFRQVERTWRRDGDSLSIIASGEVKFRDNSNRNQLNEGNGVRFAEADNILDGFATVKGNKAIAARAKNNSEFIGNTREDGLNNAWLSDSRITANPYVEYSNMAARAGGTFAFVWENSAPNEIKPGTMVKIMYLKEDEIVEIYGVLQCMESYTHTAEAGFVASQYRTNTMLAIFVKSPPKDA